MLTHVYTAHVTRTPHTATRETSQVTSPPRRKQKGRGSATKGAPHQAGKRGDGSAGAGHGGEGAAAMNATKALTVLRGAHHPPHGVPRLTAVVALPWLERAEMLRAELAAVQI